MRALPAPVELDADDQALLRQTIDYYHQRLKETAEEEGSAQAYLAARGLDHPALVDTFRLGVADRTLGLRLASLRSSGPALAAPTVPARSTATCRHPVAAVRRPVLSKAATSAPH